MSNTLEPMIARYAEGSRLLRDAVRGMSREQQRARPIAGKWSSLEVICHLADFEPIYVDRMKRVLALDQPQLIGADETRFAAALAYHQREMEEELSLLEHTHAQMARILRTLPAEALRRIGVHNERGPLTLEDLLTGATKHVAHHLRFLLEKRQALGLPA